MYPTITVLGYDITSYSICAVIGIAISALYVWAKTKKRTDLDSLQLVNIAAVSGLGAFFGAHILFGITNISKISSLFSAQNSPADVARILIEMFGGMVFYGGLIGGILTGIYYIKHLKHIVLDPMVYADVFAPAIPLFHIFGRIGCFFGGCCYGMESKWGFVYHNAPIPESNDVVRLPIQLIESFGNLIIFLILNHMSKKPHYNGRLMFTYLTIYPIMRFILEFFRGDVVRGFFLGLSTSQWVSVILFIVAITLTLKENRSTQNS